MNILTPLRPLLLLLLPLLFLCPGCHFNSTFRNREKDKNDAEKVTTAFYELIKQKNYKGTHPFFSDTFFDVTDTSELNKVLRLSAEKLGPIESIQLTKWQTLVVSGTDDRSEYALEYAVKHEHYEATEIFTLIKEKGQIKIQRYRVNSEVFQESGNDEKQ